MDTLVRAVQRMTAFVAAAFVVLLFVNEPAKPPPVPKTGTANAGATIFSTRCAGCHGADAGGGFGPALRGVVVSRFPDPAEQEAIVRGGQGSMPAFESSLTPDQITAVVEYTRTIGG